MPPPKVKYTPERIEKIKKIWSSAASAVKKSPN